MLTQTDEQHAEPVADGVFARLQRVADQAVRQCSILFATALVIVAGGVVLAPEPVLLPLVGAGGTLAAISALLLGLALYHRTAQATAYRILTNFIANDAAPSFATDSDGVIRSRNAAARDRMDSLGSQTLASVLRTVFANPSAVLFRLQSKAESVGSAREDLVTRQGHYRLAVHGVGNGMFLWRIEDILERPNAGRGADSLSIPLITVGRTDAVLFMNEAARQLIGSRVKALDRLFLSLPYTSGQPSRITTADGPREVLVSEVSASAGRREVYLVPMQVQHGPQDWTMFQDLPVPLLKVAPGGEILMANTTATSLLGAKIGENTVLSDVMEGLGRAIPDWLAQAAQANSTPRSEFLRLTRRDREVFVQVTLNRCVEATGTALIAVLSDATELKTLEAQFVQSQKMQAIGQLAGASRMISIIF